MASTELKRTISSAGSQTKWGASAWVKRCDLGLSAGIYCSSKSDTTANNRGIFFNADDKIECAFYDGGYTYQVVTNRKFRDTNAWYHVVVNLDTSQSTAADRIKIWVNGVQETSMATSNYPSQNSTHNFLGTDITQLVGSLREGSSIHHSCVISHLHFTDGYCYPASTFGSTDSVTGEWQINTSPTVANYGTNGFFILKDGNSVTDQSGQSNNLTVSAGTLTKTEDNPSNVFDTINTNFAKTGGVAGRDSGIRIFIDNGNTRLSTDVALWTTMCGSIPMTTGKYYWECMRTFEGSPTNHLARVGIEEISTAGTTLGSPVGTNTASINYQSEGGGIKQNSAYSGTFASWQANNDIVSVAIDLDNNFIYFGKNGTWQNSGDPTSGGSGTGGIAITAGKTYVTGFTVHRGGGSSGGDKSMLKMNFGNGYFQNTAVTSAGTNASGLGIFEFDVPAGYSAICTKGLNL